MTALPLPESQAEAREKDRQNVIWLFTTLVGGALILNSYLAGWLLEGKIRFETDIVDGLENAPASLDRLFTGKNLGKLVVRVSDEP